MLSPNELNTLRQYLGPDGKLIISDNLSDAKKERFEFINSLNLNLVELFSRNTKLEDVEDVIEDDIADSEYDSDEEEDIEYESEEDFEFVEEEDTDIVDDLNDIF